MSKKNKKTSYGIIGLGRFGYALATELIASNADIIVLDKDEEKVRSMREHTENAFVVSSLDKKTLLETGIQNCDTVIVCISEKMDVSILTTLHLKSMGVPTVIAKASSQEHGEVLEKLGAEVVYPERDMAIRIAHRLENAKTLDFVQLSERVNISKFILPDSLAGKSVSEVNFRGKFGVNIIAIENDGTVAETITPDYVFKNVDILFVAGSKDGINNLLAFAGNGN